MSDPTGAPAPDSGTVRLPQLEAARDEDAALQREIEEIGAAADPPDPLIERARQLLDDAKQIGSITWQFRERDELDAIAMRAVRIIRQSGERVEPVRIEPFRTDAGGLPSFEHMTVDEFAEALRKGPVVGRRLEDADLTGLRELEETGRLEVMDCAFIGCDFSGVNLGGARVLHSVFDGCNFASVDLTAATLTSSLIKGESDDDGRGGRGFADVRADRANFSGSRLDLLTLDTATFVEATFSYAYLSRIEAAAETSFTSGIFDLATVEDFTAAEADFSGALFIGCNLLNVDFTRTNLRDAVFSSARVGGTVFRGADLSNARLRSAYFVGRAAFDKETVLDGAEFDPRDAEGIRKGLAQSDEADIGDEPGDHG